MSLESLPNELKRSLLKAAPDVATLSVVVHASPLYHAVYLTAREECLTEVTLRELEGHNIDVLTPYTFIEVCTKGNHRPGGILKKTIEQCYRATQNHQAINLISSQCCALMTLTDLNGWSVQWKDEIANNVYARSFYPQGLGRPETHEHQIEIPRLFEDYRFPLADYKFITFDPNLFPAAKPDEMPSLVITALFKPDGEEYIACRILVSYEGKRSQSGDPEPGMPVETGWDTEEEDQEDEQHPMVFSKRIPNTSENDPASKRRSMQAWIQEKAHALVS